MRYCIPLFCAVAVLAGVTTVTVVINAAETGNEETTQPFSPAEVETTEAENAASIADQLTVVVYPVADLPVWSSVLKKGEAPTFAPTVLIALIRAIDPQSWQDDGGSVSRHESTASLVIRTTRANHERVVELLESLRVIGRDVQERELPVEESDDVSDATRAEPSEEKRQKLSPTRTYDQWRTDVCNTIFHAARCREKNPVEATAQIDAEIQSVQSAELTERQKSPLLNSLERYKIYIATGNYPEDESKMQSGGYEPLTSSNLDKLLERAVQVNTSTSQATEYDRQLLVVVIAIFKSEQLARFSMKSARKAVETARQSLQKSTLAGPLKSRLEERLAQHEKELERRRLARHARELFGVETFGTTILPSQPKTRPLTPPAILLRNQPFGVETWSKEEMFKNRPSRLYLDQEVIAEGFVGG